MTLHKKPEYNTPEMLAALEKHNMVTKVPSMLSDAFRLGWSAAQERIAKVREPTRAQKRQIMDLLDEVYDTKSERYMRGDTDDTVADVLKVMPGWVAQIRKEALEEAKEQFVTDPWSWSKKEIHAKIDALIDKEDG